MTNPDRLKHLFVTFLGLPPDADDKPVCGAELTSAYNGHGAPNCPACDAAVPALLAKGTVKDTRKK